jgi:ATP-binding cassette subfamily C protein LapB
MLLLDEPTSSLDMRSELQFLRSLKSWLNADATRSLVIATHKTSTLDLVRRVIVLHDGQVDLDGTTAQVMNTLARRAAPTGANPASGKTTPQPATPTNGKHVDRDPTLAATR